MIKKYFLFTALFIVLTLWAFASSPSPATEIRAVWLTTNYGLDWPRNRFSQEMQKRELIGILDNLQKYHFNTVMFQVRARGEAFYHSKFNPLSSLIVSGGYGKADFDPLAFVIEEAHRRSMEVHAWMITYPLGSDKQVRSLGGKSIVRKNPSIVRKYKGEWFLDPGNPQTDNYLLHIVAEIVDNYDIDGIHFDYIRYPDNSRRFPDAAMYRLHGKGKSLEEWRRDNITRFVVKAYDLVKSKKRWVQISSSPLGRYRSINGSGRGWTAFETVFQDAASWLKMGKHDALYPMMYYKDHLFFPYLDDWMRYGNGRFIVPGLGVYQMIELSWSLRDITDQIDYSRRKASQGQIFFRTDNLLSNTKGVLNKMEEYYRYPAKLPAMTWLSDSVPEKVSDLRAEDVNGKLRLEWISPNVPPRATYNVYRSETDNLDVNKAENLLAAGLRQTHFEYAAVIDEKAYYYFVTVSDSYHNESPVCVPAFFVHSDLEK